MNLFQAISRIKIKFLSKCIFEPNLGVLFDVITNVFFLSVFRRKYEEICAPRLDEFCFMTDNTYMKEDVCHFPFFLLLNRLFLIILNNNNNNNKKLIIIYILSHMNSE
jgi:hypothetical protein